MGLVTRIMILLQSISNFVFIWYAVVGFLSLSLSLCVCSNLPSYLPIDCKPSKSLAFTINYWMALTTRKKRSNLLSFFSFLFFSFLYLLLAYQSIQLLGLSVSSKGPKNLQDRIGLASRHRQSFLRLNRLLGYNHFCTSPSSRLSSSLQIIPSQSQISIKV